MADWTALVTDQSDTCAWQMHSNVATTPAQTDLSDTDVAALPKPMLTVGQPDAPSLEVPAALPLTAHLTSPDTYVLPSLHQTRPRAKMGKAAAQLNGLDAHDPEFDGVACVVGVQTHWVRISAREVVSFQTSLTGRLIVGFGKASCGAGFGDAVERSLSRPSALASDLAEADLTSDQARITGHFVGADIAAARAYWLGQVVLVIGDGPLADAYTQALTSQGATPSRLGGEAVLLAGMAAAYAGLAG